MSQTTVNVSAIGDHEALRSTVVANAQSVGEMYQQALVLAPALAAALEAKTTPASLTPLGSAIGGIVGGLSSHFALGWSEQFDGVVAGTAALAVGYVVHWWQARSAKPLLPEITPLKKGQ